MENEFEDDKEQVRELEEMASALKKEAKDL